MGSSKKHKEKDREHKHKRKRRSRSKERRSKRKDREEKRQREEKRERRRSNEDSEKEGEDYEEATNFAVGASGGGGEASLSIEETNRLRAKLGLKPLDVPGSGNTGGDAAEDGGKPKENEDVHVPAVNLAEQKKTENLREKMAILKQKRILNRKLSKVKALGDSDSDTDDISKWVHKSRKVEKEKILAEKRAKLLEEMDEEFGISDLVDEEFMDKSKEYSAKNLRGLRVEHGMEKFKDGRGVVLTLKDKGILDDDQDDVLVNVNIIDDEKAEKNLEKKKTKPEYKPYDEPEYDEYGMPKPKNLLEKYDEDIDGNKAIKKSFQLGYGGKYDADEERQTERIRQALREQGQTLSMAEPSLASEYYTAEEAAAKFKKVKKKTRKIRKKTTLKADDLLQMAEGKIEDYGSRSRGRGQGPLEDMDEEVEVGIQGAEVIDYGHGGAAAETTVIDYGHGQVEDVKVKIEPVAESWEHGRRTLPDLSRVKIEKMDVDAADNEYDIEGPDEDLTGVVVDDEEVENELHSALNKARKLKLKRDAVAPVKVAERVQNIESEETKENESKESVIVLNSVSEFCRNLGEIPTYGLSGNREEEREEIMDVELELMEQKRRQEEIEEAASGWNEVDIDTRPVDITGEEKAVLEEEPIATDGVGSALALAMKKGYLEKEVLKKAGAASDSFIQAQYYSIEDKRYDDLDEKYRKRDRYSTGVITDFSEKDGYRPDVKLEYVDDSGRLLNPKEAFRQLSHRFHGKGSGKKKTEKRMKKLEEEQLMKQMSSTDTPLNTLSLLQDKQKAEKSPFVVLSGSKGFTANTTNIVKP